MLEEDLKNEAIHFFEDIQNKLLTAFEQVDGTAKATKKTWDREQGGGGTMGVIRGSVVEKAGANFSKVYGEKYPGGESEFKDRPFFASGVSTITHMMNPFAPIGHMNVKLITAGSTFWFGGGADLTPFKPFEEDTEQFHQSLKDACQLYGGTATYEKFSSWCDEYFFIKHRKEVRGVGGIFFDFLKGSFEDIYPFVQATAKAYVDTFPEILNRRKNHPYTEEDKDAQLYWRGRYAEYNLIYDRGTKFGLSSGGNHEAIFVSLPPVVKW